MTFNPNVPTGLVPLDQDYLNLQNNNQALDNVYGVNHLKFSNSTGNKGKHTQVEMQVFASIPTGLSVSEGTGG